MVNPSSGAWLVPGVPECRVGSIFSQVLKEAIWLAVGGLDTIYQIGGDFQILMPPAASYMVGAYKVLR